MDYRKAFSQRFKQSEAPRAGIRPSSNNNEDHPAPTDRPSPHGIRGGRDSEAWGKPTHWRGGRVPEDTDTLVKRLALGHNLHQWQVIAEAVRCFAEKYGPGKGKAS